jgi:hypothetical protein
LNLINSEKLYLSRVIFFSLNTKTISNEKIDQFLNTRKLILAHNKSNSRFNFKESDNNDNKILKKYSNLKMYRIIQFQFLRIKSNAIYNQSVRNEIFKLIKMIIVFFLLVVLYITTYIGIVIFITNIFANYKFTMITMWLLPSLIQLFVVRFITNYIINLIKSIILFKFYVKIISKEWEKYFFIFQNIIGNDIIYMYEIRNFLNKYYHKLSEIK